MISPELPVAVL
uniref:Uncharacterized protein n=1 Tax=Arundo donax TaxID=35708 RepID=A0A0A9APC5_ARUDO